MKSGGTASAILEQLALEIQEAVTRFKLIVHTIRTHCRHQECVESGEKTNVRMETTKKMDGSATASMGPVEDRCL
jgi:hypothetical protein